MTSQDFLFIPRDYRDIELWKNVTEREWADPNWQRQNAVKDIETLSKVIQLSEKQKESIGNTIAKMMEQGKEPLRITPYYLTLMAQTPFEPSYPNGEVYTDRLDPVFWMAVPTPAHLLFQKAGCEEAMAESTRSYAAFYQRYPNRGALLVASNTSCASFCTHCQRTKSLDATTSVTTENIRRGLYYIDQNKNLDEILITGGDALMISPKLLKFVLEELSRMKHIRSIRIATRVPVVLPMGITHELLELIKASANRHGRKHVYFATHVNHYHEVTLQFRDAISRIASHGFTVLNQMVFLNHVNADFETLVKTSNCIWWAGAKPYYLLHCHNEEGLTHFIPPVALGQRLVMEMRGWSSGTSKPSYSINLKGGGKIMLMPSGYHTDGHGTLLTGIDFEPFPTVFNWRKETITDYEVLGHTTEEEYANAIKVMDEFIGKPGFFKPCVNIVTDRNRPKETYLRSENINLPCIETVDKMRIYNYAPANDRELPLTNPFQIKDKLDEGFAKSRYANEIMEHRRRCRIRRRS